MELERRKPGGVHRFKSCTIYDFVGHPDLEQRWHAMHDEAAAHERANRKRPVLHVKDGDWVKIGNRLLRVADLNLDSGMGYTERVGKNGVISGQPTMFIGLKPTTPDDPTAEPWPDQPPHLTDALSRARWYRKVHERVIEEAGLDGLFAPEFTPD